MQTLWKAKPPLKFTPRYSIFRFTIFLLCNSNGVTISVKVVSCVWRSATNLTASYLWGWEGCHGIPKRLATSTFSLTTPFSLSLSSVRNKGTGKVVLWWANIRLWANQIRKVTSKYKVQHFPFFFDNKATLLLRCGGLPGNHQNDHVTFGCAGGATEFNVIQNNCNVTQASKSPTKSSSKYESFLLFFGFLSRKRRKSRHVCQHTSLTHKGETDA